MKKQVTNEEVGQAIGKMAEKIRDDLDYEFRVAESQMWIAENDLVDSLNETQHALYKDYSEKRNAFFKIAGGLCLSQYSTMKLNKSAICRKANFTA